MSATVEINAQTCLGSAMCELMAGDLFRVGEAGVAEALKTELTGDADVDAATDAMNGCPAGAISVHSA